MVGRFIDILMKEITTEAFIYFNVIDHIMELVVAGEYTKKIIHDNKAKLIELINNIITEKKYNKYQIRLFFSNVVL